jgi:nucleoid DNA-binding protein
MKDKFKQADFVRALNERGLTYSQARRAYTAMIEAFESAMVNQQIIRLGHLGSFFPREVPARNYKMGCRKTKGGTRDPNIYEFEVGRRIKFVFKLNEAFSKRYGFR